MAPDDSRLLRHLATAVVVKLAVLAALWWLFVHDHRVPTDAAHTADHVAGGLSQPGAPR